MIWSLEQRRPLGRAQRRHPRLRFRRHPARNQRTRGGDAPPHPRATRDLARHPGTRVREQRAADRRHRAPARTRIAAIQEIHSLAEVEYDTTRGFVTADSGEGPPLVGGWVRRGGSVKSCQLWTSAVSGFPPSTGTAAQLGLTGFLGPLGWSDPSASGFDYSCASLQHVWCVQD